VSPIAASRERGADRRSEGAAPRTHDGPGRGLRVLILTNMYPTPDEPHFGCFVKDQADDLRRLGVDVRVLAFDGRTDKGRYILAARELRRACRRERFDVVHAHYGLSGVLAAAQTGAPVVTTFHGSDTWVAWQRAASWVAARRCQPIAVAQVVAARLGVSHAPVIPCAVDLDLFKPMGREEARHRLGWPVAGRCVLFPASRTDRSKIRNKRVDLFDAVVSRLRLQTPDVFTASLDGLDREHVALAMNAADVAVMTSEREGAPVVVKELLACETPVVSVPVGDVGETVRGLPGCAIVSRSPAALAEAAGVALRSGGDPMLRERMAEFGRGRIAQRVLAVYRHVLARGMAR
jgi:glycosyltransferase involved in cell wall biosynthesis